MFILQGSVNLNTKGNTKKVLLHSVDIMRCGCPEIFKSQMPFELTKIVIITASLSLLLNIQFLKIFLEHTVSTHV